MKNILASILFGCVAASSANASLIDKVYVDAAFPTGVGVGIGKSVNDNLGFRVQLSGARLDDVSVEEGTEYRVDYDASFVAAFVDYFPFSGAFRVTGGVSGADTAIKLRANGTGSAVDIDGQKVILAGQDFVEYKAALPDVVGYLGIGYGHSFEKGWYLSADLGFYFGGVTTSFSVSPSVRTIVGDAAVEREKQALDENVGDFDLIPVVGISLGYKF